MERVLRQRFSEEREELVKLENQEARVVEESTEEINIKN